ncbi:DoxX family protein [Paraglaciecola polaris]|uniref:HvfX family Cu-binding RiPP maturation protein n=1 Tax=Paraglaciecola polaris TaxID=222814 RepID=UPI0030EBC5E9
MSLVSLATRAQRALEKTSVFEGIAPLLLRLYLAPIMIQAGWTKLGSFENTVDWFASTEYGLGLPAPALLASLAIAAELLGGVFILIGLATRWASIPLMFTMLVAAFFVHWPNGWSAIADASSWLSDGTIMLNENVMSAPDKLAAAKSLLQEHGNYNWLTSSGKFVVLNNGIEFAMTYFFMLLSLFFTGGGKFTSVDHFLRKKFMFD